MSTNSIPCPHAFKYTKAGRVTDKRHRCSRACTWTRTECSEWLNSTPYPTQKQPPIQIEHEPCACGRPYASHMNSVERFGKLQGVRLTFTDACDQTSGWPTRHLTNCACDACAVQAVA
jgi:hypothetical protein